MNRLERHPALTLLVVLLALLGLVLFVSEALLRPDSGAEVVGGDSVTDPRRFLPLREWQPYTRFSFGPPETRVASARGELQEVYPLDTDQFGFIEPAVIHQDADVEIVFVGGSTTECMYVMPENRFPYLTGRLLEERLGLKVNGINAGKSGNNTMLSLLATIGKVLPRRPDYVVLMHNTNDLGVLSTHRTYWTEDSNFALVRARERSLETVVRDLRDMAFPYTYRRLRRALRQLGEADIAPSPTTALADEPAAAVEGKAGHRVPTGDAELARMGADFESALRSFVGVVRAWHIAPVLMTQVTLGGSETERAQGLQGAYLAEEQLARGDFTPDSFARTHDYLNAIIRHVALSEEVTLIDLARARQWSDADIYDGLHFLDSGSRRVAEVVATAMETLLRERFSGAVQPD